MSAAPTRGAALREIVRHGMGIVGANADGLRTRPKPEHVHQARVALRRMRSAIRLFDPRYEDFPRKLARELRWLARVLGDARDWDTVFKATLPAVLAWIDAGDGGRDLMKKARVRRAAAANDVLVSFGSGRHARLGAALAEWSASAPPTSSPPVARVAAPLLDGLAHAAFADASEFAEISRSARHRVRIRVKRLRYALDLLGFALPRTHSAGCAGYLRALAALQEGLGALNDANVARKRLVQVASRRDRRIVKDWFNAVEGPLIRQAARELSAMGRRAAPWNERAA